MRSLTTIIFFGISLSLMLFEISYHQTLHPYAILFSMLIILFAIIKIIYESAISFTGVLMFTMGFLLLLDYFDATVNMRIVFVLLAGVLLTISGYTNKRNFGNYFLRKVHVIYLSKFNKYNFLMKNVLLVEDTNVKLLDLKLTGFLTTAHVDLRRTEHSSTTTTIKITSYASKVKLLLPLDCQVFLNNKTKLCQVRCQVHSNELAKPSYIIDLKGSASTIIVDN